MSLESSHNSSINHSRWDSSEQSSFRPINATKIYVLGEDCGTIIKIGRTRQAAGKRRLQHQRRGPTSVKMHDLLWVWGFESDETYLKDYWTRKGLLEFGTEWFCATDEVRSWLRHARDLPFTAVCESELDKCPFVSDSSSWLPGMWKNYKVLKSQRDLFAKKGPWSDLTTSEVGDGDYYTHPEMTKCARLAMGSIDLDPASCKLANEHVKAKRFFGSNEDGLRMEWFGNVWLNPPFGQWDTWAPKAFAEFRSGRVKQMCVFCTANTSTSKSVHWLLGIANAVFMPCGRFGCWGPKSSTPTAGNFIFYFGENVSEFVAAFSKHGTIFFGKRETT